MSGPKSSRYTLTPEQRRILAEQRKLELRKMAARNKIKKSQKHFLALGSMASSVKPAALELLKRTGDDRGVSSLISQLETLISPLSPMISKTDPNDVDSLESTAVSLETAMKEAEKIASEIASLSQDNAETLKKNLNEAIDKGFSTSFADIREIHFSNLTAIRDEAIRKLTQMKQEIELPDDFKSEIDRALSKVNEITDNIFMKNYVGVSVNPLIKRANLFLAEYRECREEFDRLYTEYTALCELYSYEAQNYPCTRVSIQKLESELEQLRNAIAKDEEQAYISECLDEVMREMGYSVLGSREVIKKNGKRFRNELYSYGDGTAVNVTYSSDGRIAMELGGMDQEDRLPNSMETAALCQSMEQFCDDFKKIEKRLLARGVVLADRLSLLPPDAEYAQIINTSDYDMIEDAEFFQISKKQKAEGTKKTLRME